MICADFDLIRGTQFAFSFEVLLGGNADMIFKFYRCKVLFQFADAFIVVNGAAAETTALLAYRWDHIFFTGGGKIGKIVATAAAQKLTPVTLELGGKNPVIVAEDCDPELAAKRVLRSKSQNSGQVSCYRFWICMALLMTLCSVVYRSGSRLGCSFNCASIP